MLGIMMAYGLLVLDLQNFRCWIFVAQSVHIHVELPLCMQNPAIGRVATVFCSVAQMVVFCQVTDT